MIPKPTKKKLSKLQKAKLGLIQWTIPAEKKKALERDNYRCVCCQSQDMLDWHHIFWHSSERIYDETRNLFYRGVTLCRRCHMRIPESKSLDEACRMYLRWQHPEIYTEI